MDTGKASTLKGLTILVTGGCGYIGSHAVWKLLESGLKVVVIDTLEFGDKSLIDPTLSKQLFGRDLGDDELHFYQGSIGDADLLEKILSAHKIDAVFNFAAYIEVGESVEKPLNYYENNTVTVIQLLKALLRHKVRYFVQSSTAAVYGEVTGEALITEADPTVPINPYGFSKLMVERILEDTSKAHDLKFICFRYFNVCGCHPSSLIGRDKPHATHLIPLVLRAASNQAYQMKIFGEDYETRDGTAIRDYVDVEDLLRGHILGLEYLMKEGSTNQTMNLGSSKGFTVKEVINSGKKVTGIDFQVAVVGRRAGDPKMLVASNTRAKEVLGWEPQVTLEESITNAWNLLQKLKQTSK